MINIYIPLGISTCYSSQMVVWWYRIYFQAESLRPSLLELPFLLKRVPLLNICLSPKFTQLLPLPPIGYFYHGSQSDHLKHRQPCHLATHDILMFPFSASLLWYTQPHRDCSPAGYMAALLSLSLSWLPSSLSELPHHSS